MKHFTLLQFAAFCCVAIADLPDAASNRNLFNEKWSPTPKQDTRHHQWTYRGAATASQYTNRVGHKSPKKGDDADDEEYYNYGQTDEDLYYDAARPSEKEFDYHDTSPKQGKQDSEGKVRGIGVKRNKSDGRDYEHDTDPKEDNGTSDGKGTSGGKGRSIGRKAGKPGDKRKRCTEKPCKYEQMKKMNQRISHSIVM